MPVMRAARVLPCPLPLSSTPSPKRPRGALPTDTIARGHEKRGRFDACYCDTSRGVRIVLQIE
ncbi:unnamed protein product [Ixodes pacificus]